LGELLERGHLDDLGVDGRVALKCIFKKLDGGMEGADLTQDMDRRRDFVNTVVNLRIP